VWLENDDRRLLRSSSCIAVEVLVELTPALPQPFTLLAACGPAEHLVSDPACQLDDRLREPRAPARRPPRPVRHSSRARWPAPRERGLAQGFTDFLKKPFTSVELEQILDKVMGKSS